MTVSHDLSWFKDSLTNTKLVEKIKKLKLIIADVDGSLTDGMIYVQEDKEDLKGYGVPDGYATAKAIKAGLLIGFLTGKTGTSIAKRARTIGIPDSLCFLGVGKEKIKAVQKMQQTVGVSQHETLIFGDDHLDIEAQPGAALFAVPHNAPFYIRHYADMLIPKGGGENAFRLLLDLILFVQEKHFAQKIIEAVISGETVHD